jgi:GntR family transcriptional regulator
MKMVDHVPRYLVIEHEMRTRIAALQPGDALPSDVDLCAEFGVSRMTARNAMQRLAEEGIVVRQPGRGSFVAATPAHRRADHLMTFTREMERRGRVPSSRVLAREIRPSTRQEAASLEIIAGEPVVAIRRVRRADGEAIAIESAVLHRSVTAVVMEADLERGSLHEALARAGHVLRRGTGTISAAAATREDARQLGIRTGEPLLVERRVIMDAAGRRIESTESRYPGDRYELDVRFDVMEAT